VSAEEGAPRSVSLKVRRDTPIRSRGPRTDAREEPRDRAMSSKLRAYLVLPGELSDAEGAYLGRVNRIALWLLVAHVPLMTIVAAVNGTGPLLALLLTSVWLVGPVLAHLAMENPRHTARVSGFTAMVMGALLVHFGQGPMQIEMRLHFFVLLGLLVVFADPLVVVVAAATVVAHHAVFFVYLPKSVFHLASIGTLAVHGAFFALESVAACVVARSLFDHAIGLDRAVQRRSLILTSAVRGHRGALRAREGRRAAPRSSLPALLGERAPLVSPPSRRHPRA
jgi:two-component system, chemotaxis family, sensor kinase CheA